MSSHLEAHVLHPALRSDNTLHVVSCISNPVRYQSRYRLARDFIKHISGTSNVKFHLVEGVYGDRSPELETDHAGSYLKVYINSEVWIKENLLNLGVRHLLPRDWKYLAWVDADIVFRDENWALEAIHQLQHKPLIQPWQSVVDLGATGNVYQLFNSFGFAQQSGKKMQQIFTEPYAYAHSGFAWAATRSWYEAVGGLIDFAIVGSADYHQAWASIGRGMGTVPSSYQPSYKRRVAEWQAKSVRVTNKQIGFSPGRIEHYFHGAKSARGYHDRWRICSDLKFDPDKDLTYDSQGLIKLVGRPDIELALAKYNRSRNEDGIAE